MGNISRRRFLYRIATVLGAGWLLSACRKQGEIVRQVSQLSPATATPRSTYTPTATSTITPAPTSTSPPLPTATLSPTVTYPPPPVSTSTPLPPTYTPVPATPTSPPSPTATLVPTPSRASLTAHWPEVPTSRMVVVRHGGVWTGDAPDTAIVLEMLDTGIATLADGAEPLAVWRTLFDRGERVLLKVNCVSALMPTQPAATYAVAQRLQEAGLAAENILIFDRTDRELTSAGYQLNEGAPGVQCHGARGEGTEAVLTQATVRFYRELDDCDALINLPTPKGHGMAGVTVAMKNHYGSVNRPSALHGDGCDPAIAELNAQLTVRDKTRLIVGASLNVSPFDWNSPERENALLLSFDPVALDTVSRDILVRHHQAVDRDGGGLVQGSHYFATAQSMGLGANDVGLIDLREVTLA